MESVYIISIFGINIEAYRTEEEAKARVAELRAFQTLLIQTALKGEEEFHINKFYDENLCIKIEKVLLKEKEV